MSETKVIPKESKHKVEMEESMDEEWSFEELGLDPRLIRALSKTETTITKPTPIQRVAIPLILEGKDVVARAKTGSGKTLAYLLPLLHKLFADSGLMKKLSPSAFIILPSGELCHQVYKEVSSLIDWCKVQLKAVQLTTKMSDLDLRNALAGPPDILVSTPASLAKCLSAGLLQSASINDSLEILVLDEADLLLSFGYEDDLKALTALLPRRCQCLLMSATSSDDVDKIKKLILHNPYILTLPEVEGDKDEAIPKNIQQFWISCSGRDKLLHILALLKLDLVQKKVLIFTNSTDTSFRMRLFLEKFGIRSAVLNAELPQNSRLHILEEFNAGLFDHLIATDNSDTKEKKQADRNLAESRKSKKHSKQKLDSEFGVVRGIDFKNVHTVINYDMPLDVVGYVHRIGRTGRGYSTGAAVSLVSPDEMELLENVKSFLGHDENEDTNIISAFPLLTKNAVESLRYRAEDVGKSVTKIAIKEARAQDVKNEILNSKKLQAHFEANPRDKDLLEHDKILSKNLPAPHLRHVPDYLIDPTTKEASKMVKLDRAAMGNNNSGHRHNSKKRKSKDPLKALSFQASKRADKGGQKRGREHSNNPRNHHKKGKTV